MTEFNRAYIYKYLDQATNTDSEALKNDALYRLGTHIEAIECNGNVNLTPEQQQTVINEATKLLGGENDT